MRFRTMFRYGTRAVVYLAAVYPHRAVSVREIAEDQRTSRKYLEHILQILKTAGLVQSVQGKHGGYVLARSPDKITLKDLYEYMVGSLAPVNCVDQPEACPRRDDCPTWETWVEVKEAVESVLERTTVQHLLDRKKRKAISLEPVREEAKSEKKAKPSHPGVVDQTGSMPQHLGRGFGPRLLGVAFGDLLSPPG